MFEQNLYISLSMNVTTVPHGKGSHMCPVQFLPTRLSSVLLGPSVASVATSVQVRLQEDKLRSGGGRGRLYYSRGG